MPGRLAGASASESAFSASEAAGVSIGVLLLVLLAVVLVIVILVITPYGRWARAALAALHTRFACVRGLQRKEKPRKTVPITARQKSPMGDGAAVGTLTKNPLRAPATQKPGSSIYDVTPARPARTQETAFSRRQVHPPAPRAMALLVRVLFQARSLAPSLPRFSVIRQHRVGGRFFHSRGRGQQFLRDAPASASQGL